MSEREDSFRDAVQRLAEEMYRRLDGHPDLAALRAYRERRSSMEEAERLREHLAVCPDCCDLLLDAEAFWQEEPGSERLQSVGDQDAAWQRLQARISRDEGSVRLPFRPGRWSRSGAAIAASLLLALIGASYYLTGVARQRSLLTADVALVDLVPVEAGIRGIADTARVPAGTGPVVLVPCLPEPSLSGSSYKLVLEDGRKAIWSQSDLKPDSDGCFALAVTRGWLPASGLLRLELYDLKGGQENFVASYEAEIERSNE